MVKTALVKTATNVAIVTMVCVMVVVLRWSLEELASKRVDWFRLQYQKSWGSEIGQNDKKMMIEFHAEKSVCLGGRLEGRKDSCWTRTTGKEQKLPTCKTVGPAACHRGQGCLRWK